MPTLNTKPVPLNTKQMRILTAALLLGLAPAALASSFYTTSDALSGAVKSVSDGISGTSGSFSENKIVLAARDDAASHVASDGAIRGVHLEAALELLRQRVPEARTASDMELAQAILAL